ncbi:MAG: hypothetical protein IJJ26_05775, partial [Victivallales bacterium]|nr:hypothetical protein [Victivallales bacterium]
LHHSNSVWSPHRVFALRPRLRRFGGRTVILELPQLLFCRKTCHLAKKDYVIEGIAKLLFESTEYTEYTEGNPPLRGGLHFVFCFISSV